MRWCEISAHCQMPIYTAKRLSRITGLSLTQSMSAADEIGKNQKQKQQQQESWNGSVGSSKGNGVSRSTRSIKSKPRSVSPPKNRISYDWEEFSSIEIEEDPGNSKSKSSDDLLKKQRTSRRWNLRDLLYRSSSEGNDRRKEREKLLSAAPLPPAGPSKRKTKAINQVDQLEARKPINGVSTKTKLSSPSASPTSRLKSNKNSVTKQGVAMSSHELYYQTNRAQAKELKKRSFLPYRQGLLGCMGPFPTTTSNHHTLQPSTC